MKKYLIAGALSVAGMLQLQTALAQNTPATAPAPTQLMSIEAGGERSRVYGNVDVTGSPFLNDNWINGTAITNKGEKYEYNLKYDIVADQPIFAGTDNMMMRFVAPITRFTLNDEVYQNGFPAAGDWTATTFYKVLGTGKTKLLKHYYKKKMEVRDIGGISGYNYEDNVACYLLKEGKMTGIKPNKGAIVAALADRKDQVEAYIKTSKTDFKKDEDLAKLIDYYNSL